MITSTLCYIIKNNNVLLLHRNKKLDDPNYGKYIGIGGKVHPQESINACMIREVKEETNFDVVDYHYRGVITFHSDLHESETMHLFLITEVKNELQPCDEGDLVWVELTNLFDYPMWEGDIHFLRPLFQETTFLNITLQYINSKLAHVTRI